LQLSEAYATRPIRFLELWRFGDWRLKVYAITYGSAPLGASLSVAAREVAELRLAQSAGATRHYGVGFVGIHQGRGCNFVFVDWWADENELHHHVYVSPTGNPAALEYVTPTGLKACTWDLFLMAHERNAWVECVLKQPEAPDLAAYLATTFNGHI